MMTKILLASVNTEDDNIPLPLIVARYFNFPLAHTQTENGLVYAVQDWLRGLLGDEDVRYVLSNMHRNHPELKTFIKMLPYRASNKRVFRRPYTNEERLLYILLLLRLRRGRSRLVDIRNFIADLAPVYKYLRCFPVKSKILNESEFQQMLVIALKAIIYPYELREYVLTASEHIIDIVAYKVEDNPNYPHYILVECKVKKDDFYKAVGQVFCYNVEISRLFESDNATLAIAIPYEIIDDYMRDMAASLTIRLISIVDGTVIDAITNEPFSLI